MYVTEILQQLGHDVTLAENGKIAVETVKDATFDLVLMDCDMPVMTGWVAAAHIADMRKSGTIPDIPVIALTANQMEGDAEKCFAAGMDDYIAKSIWRPRWKPNIERIINKWLDSEDQSGVSKEAIDMVTFFEMRDMLWRKFTGYVKLYWKTRRSISMR